MTLDSKFGDLALNEPIKIEIEGETLELDLGVDDMVPLMSMGSSSGDIGEGEVEKLTETFRKILYRSYLPYWDKARDKEPANLSDNRQEENEEVKEYVDGLLVRKLPILINKVVSSLGWADSEDGMNQGNFPDAPSR
jgi:hypothetical protein